jgi:predicted TIM-barrel fold metal-dependent hydrolase
MISRTNSMSTISTPAAQPPSAELLPKPQPAQSPVLAPAKESEYNRTGSDFRRPMPRPKVSGAVIDFHCHLLAARHAKDWFETADHYGIDRFFTMCQLEEAMGLQRDWGDRLHFIAVPPWRDPSPGWLDTWFNRVEAFYNIGSRIVKFHMAPATMAARNYRLDSPMLMPLFRQIIDRRMAVMTHVGDPDTWYHGKYAADPAKYGTRDGHYQMWESVLATFPKDLPWIGAHMGGNPENLPRLQRLLDTYSNLYLDCSATRWMVREISVRRDEAREFFVRNQDRILFGSDQVSGDDREFDFLASRFWCHRKLWETAYIGPSPILDPDLSEDQQPTMHGLALPDEVLQKLYHDNAVKVMGMVGVNVEAPRAYSACA